MPGAGEMPLPRVARIAELPAELAFVTDVEEDEARLAQAGQQLFPRHVAVCRHRGYRGSAATMSISAAIAGRSPRRSSQLASAGYSSSETPRRSRARITQGT